MKNVKLISAPVCFGFLFLLASASGAADKYVRITQDKTDILTGPRDQATVVCQGQKGDVFRILGREGDWYVIEMFSGDGRYLRKTAAQVAAFRVSAPRDISRRKAIFTALFEAEGQAQQDALTKDKWGGVVVDPALFKILADRYKLAVMRRFAVQTPVYGQIRTEGRNFQ